MSDEVKTALRKLDILADEEERMAIALILRKGSSGEADGADGNAIFFFLIFILQYSQANLRVIPSLQREIQSTCDAYVSYCQKCSLMSP